MTLTLDRLEPHHCLFIVCVSVDGKGARYCGAPRQPRSSYCPVHHAICWYPVGKAQRRAQDPSVPSKPARPVSAFKLRERR